MATKGNNITIQNGSGARLGRPPKGNLSSYKLASGHRVWRARVTAYGQMWRFKLGEEPTLTESEARARLEHIAEQVAAGVWVPPNRAPAPPPPQAVAEPTIQQLCEEYANNLRRNGVDEDTWKDRVVWRIQRHILPELGELRPSDMTPERVQVYRDAKDDEREPLDDLREAGITHGPDGTLLPRGLAPSSINKMLSTLFSVLDRGAVFHGTQDTKLLRKADLFLEEDEPVREAFLPEQMLCVLDAAAELDAPGHRYSDLGRVGFVGCLGEAGLRITEGCDLNVGDYRDGKLYVRQSTPVRRRRRRSKGQRARTVKTVNAVREVDVVVALAGPLDRQVAARRAAGASDDDPLFPTATGSRRDKDNARERVVKPVMRRARELARERGVPAFPDVVKPHDFRRTFATHRTIVTRDPRYVARQLGQGSTNLLDIYDVIDDRRAPSALRLRLWGDEHDLRQAAA